MDIKTLLLESLSSKRPIRGSRRIHCGKSCIIIKYVIIGNILSIKTIKINRPHNTWTQRIKNYKKNLRTHRRTKNSKSNLSNILHIEKQDKETLTEYLNKTTKDIQTETAKLSSITRHATTQTIDVPKAAKEIQTETLKPPPKLKEMSKLATTTKPKSVQNQSISLTTTAQQTIASARFGRSKSFNNKNVYCSKTNATIGINVACKAIQCKRPTQNSATNTDTNMRDAFAQVEHDLPGENNSLLVELKKRYPLPAEELGMFIYMLNEIGETVINQNDILKCNTEMIKQMIQISKPQKWKHLNNPSHRSIATQADRETTTIDKKTNFCQTDPECIKKGKLLLFKRRNSQHKKAGKFLNED